MKHFASSKFWAAYQNLPLSIRKLADDNYDLLKQNPRHPSLHFKKVGRYWSVRIGFAPPRARRRSRRRIPVVLGYDKLVK